MGYTREAWAMNCFPDTEDSEDDIFMKELRQKCTVKLVSPEGGRALVAHSFHDENTGGMEFNGSRRLGKACEAPSDFVELLSLARKARRERSPWCHQTRRDQV